MFGALVPGRMAIFLGSSDSLEYEAKLAEMGWCQKAFEGSIH